MVASDELFRINPAAAYAEAWAMSFFLVETEPAKYVEYLKRTAARPPFDAYTAAERTADFTAVFGARLADAGGPAAAIHGRIAVTWAACVLPTVVA